MEGGTGRLRGAAEIKSPEPATVKGSGTRGPAPGGGVKFTDTRVLAQGSELVSGRCCLLGLAKSQGHRRGEGRAEPGCTPWSFLRGSGGTEDPSLPGPWAAG